jgi:hypothetical protein
MDGVGRRCAAVDDVVKLTVLESKIGTRCCEVRNGNLLNRLNDHVHRPTKISSIELGRDGEP